MVYLKYFGEHANYSAYTESDEFILPNVSACFSQRHIHYNPSEDAPRYTRTMRFVNTGPDGGTVEVVVSGFSGESITFQAPAAPQVWNEHSFIGWSMVENPSYSYISDGNLIPEGWTITEEDDATLYAVYSTTFQGLIDEGYVTLGTAEPTGDITIIVANNNYPKELVTDFMDVFESKPNKIVSISGKVGSGTTKNVFYFPQEQIANSRGSFNSTYWLTSDEWYDLFNNTKLPYYPCSNQFYGMDWSNKESIRISYGAGDSNWCAMVSAFGPKSPRVLNIDLCGAQFAYMCKTFGHVSNGCSSEIISLSAATGNRATAAQRKSSPMGFNALFEGCTSLKEIHGMDVTGVEGLAYMFDGCRSIERIEQDDFVASEWVADTMIQTFCNCWNLEEIEPIINVSGANDTNAAFYSCYKLSDIRLKGINAAVNVNSCTGVFGPDSSITWDLSSTNISQQSANYIEANLTECDASVPGFIHKIISFPAGISFTNQQILNFFDNGWLVYVGGMQIIP